MNNNYKDLTNQKFGKLTAKYISGKSGREYKWYCECDCGGSCETRGSSLRNGHTTSCGKCKQYELIGQKFGSLTVLEVIAGYFSWRKKHTTICWCKCDCGNEHCISMDKLKSKRNPNISCGCLTNKQRKMNNPNNFKNIDGQKFDRLTVIKSIYKDGEKTLCECKCDCGEKIIIPKTDILSKHTQSCGCLQRENASIVNSLDISNTVLDNNIKILSKHHFNKTWYYNCECPMCRKIFVGIPAKLKYSCSCGCIKMSNFEYKFKLILDKLNIDYLTQKRFKDCKYIYTLPFDFYLKKYNILIEIDGQGHYYPIDCFGGEDGFKKTKIRDEIKNKYCKSNNIQLLRIPYWEFENLELLENEIKNIIKNA